MQLKRPIQTRFRYDYPTRVNLATHPNSQAHSSKGTPSPPPKKALTDCKRTVSGTISLPSRGTFHHSLTVLIHYRSHEVFRFTQWSVQIHTRFHEPRATREHHKKSAGFHLPDYHGLRSSFPTDSPIPHLYHSLTPRRRNHAAPTTPNMQRPTAITHTRFNLIRFRSPLLTEYLFLRVLRCFTSPRYPQSPYTFR